MERHELGRSGLKVPPPCFGGNVFGWTVDEARSFSLLDALVDAGLGFIDTSDIYSRWVPGHEGGESETIIGRWLTKRGGRDRVIIAATGLPRYESLQPLYNLMERPAFGGARAGLPYPACRRHFQLLARERIPDRQIPVGGGYRQPGTRQPCQKLFGRARHAGVGGARRGRYGPDRERHQCPATRRTARRDTPQS